MIRKTLKLAGCIACMLFLWALFANGALAQSKVNFEKEVLPLLEAHCIECHRAPYEDARGRLRKPKAGLRLDGKGFLLKGSHVEKVLIPGNAVKSSLVQRVALPADHEDIMPPKGEPLSPEQIDRLRRWVAEGADFGTWQGAAGSEAKVSGTSVPVPSYQKKLGALAAGLEPLSRKTIERAAGSKALIWPVATGSPLLRVSFQGSSAEVKDRDLAALLPLAAHVVELHLGRTKVTDRGPRDAGQDEPLDASRPAGDDHSGFWAGESLWGAASRGAEPLRILRFRRSTGSRAGDQVPEARASLAERGDGGGPLEVAPRACGSDCPWRADVPRPAYRGESWSQAVWAPGPEEGRGQKEERLSASSEPDRSPAAGLHRWSPRNINREGGALSSTIDSTVDSTIRGRQVQSVTCLACASREHVLLFEKHSFRYVRCAACDLVYVTPQLLPEEIARLYAEGFETKSARKPQPVDDSSFQSIFRLLERGQDPGRKRRLLDVGCFTGHFLSAAARRGYDVQGTEICHDAADLATRACGGTVHVWELNDVAIEKHSLDAITMLDVVEHLRDPVADLERARTWLREGGVLYLETPNFQSLARRRFGKRWSVFFPWHLTYFTAETLTRTLALAGLRIRSLWPEDLGPWSTFDPYLALERRSQGAPSRTSRPLKDRLMPYPPVPETTLSALARRDGGSAAPVGPHGRASGRQDRGSGRVRRRDPAA